MEQNEQLQAIVETIVRVAQPEQVILFGSGGRLDDDPDALTVRSCWVVAGWHPPED